MEPWLCIAGGACLIASSFVLSRMRLPDWTDNAEVTPQMGRSLARWSFFQRIVRRCNNWLLALTGVLICLTGFVPHGRAWIMLWLSVLLLIVLVLLLAGLDALSSMASYRRAVPDVARRAFREQPDPEAQKATNN